MCTPALAWRPSRLPHFPAYRRPTTGICLPTAAASFKHVSPAGAAVYAPVSEDMLAVYEASGKELSNQAIAYLRSRQADPLCSFGDFVAVSGTVDMSTAQLLKIEVHVHLFAHAHVQACAHAHRHAAGMTPDDRSGRCILPMYTPED